MSLRDALAIPFVLVGLIAVIWGAVAYYRAHAAPRVPDRYIAKGANLDRLASVYGLQRRRGETDLDLRERCLAAATRIGSRREKGPP
jgi:hypothetical protein